MDKIKSIQVIPLIRRLKQVFEGSTYKIVSRNTLYVRVETQEGIIGEAFGGDEDIYQGKVVEVANEFLAPPLIGRELQPIETLWQMMFATQGLPLHNRSIHTLDMVNHAILMQAIAIIDMGLWDTVGKQLGQPLATLWGAHRDRVPVVGIGGYYRPGREVELAEEINRYIDLGLSGIKLKVGRWSVEEDIKRVQFIRNNFPESFVIACDANQAWNYSQACQFAAAVKGLKVEWLEEPLCWYDQMEGLKRLRQKTSIPIVAGQGEISSWGCRDLILNGCVDMLNVDATIAGGITEWRKIASFANLMNINMGHHEEPQVALHLLAASCNGKFVEIFPDRERDPMWYELVAEQPKIFQGYMHLPPAPGFGLTYNKEILDRYGERVKVHEC